MSGSNANFNAGSLDPTRPVRAGEEIDVDKLRAFLDRKLPELAGPITVEQFPKGHSNLTYLLRIGDREVVLRRPPGGAKAIKAGHDMHREFRMMHALLPVYPKVPRTLLYCDENESPLGVSFYVMERVSGLILRAKAPEGIDLNAEVMRSLSEAFVDNLVELHRIDVQKSGLSELGKPQGYVARQVSGWTERYQKARTDDIPEMERIAKWMAEHQPPEQSGTVIHNDYKYDNLVLDPQQVSNIRAVLDWEMATLGDPLSDLGTTLAYWFEPSESEVIGNLGLGLTTLPGNLSREGVLARYAQKSGRDVSNIVFYYVNALFKVAVIAQQIYSRYKQGFTSDERFAGMIFAVHMLAQTGVNALEKGRISNLL
jgi:aminoglycoside phosphotransferase (APT) family kinase protein